jgi:hypothetical protein
VTEAGSASSRRVSTGVTLTLGLVTGFLGLVGNIVASFVTKWSGSLSWFAVPIAAVAMAVVGAFATSHVKNRIPNSGDTQASSRTGLSLPAALFAIVLILGVGGFAATLGIRYVVGYISGNEPGTDRLVQSVAIEAQGLTVRVTKFEETRHFTRLTVTVRNHVGKSLSLPLFKNCVVVGGNGTTLEADAFRSDWSESIAAGARQSGTITVTGHLPAGVRRASLAFSTVFEQGFEGPDTIRVTGLRLSPRT